MDGQTIKDGEQSSCGEGGRMDGWIEGDTKDG